MLMFFVHHLCSEPSQVMVFVLQVMMRGRQIFSSSQSSVMKLPGGGGVVAAFIVIRWFGVSASKLFGWFSLSVVRGRLFTIAQASYNGVLKEASWSLPGETESGVEHIFHTSHLSFPHSTCVTCMRCIEYKVTLLFYQEVCQSLNIQFLQSFLPPTKLEP